MALACPCAGTYITGAKAFHLTHPAREMERGLEAAAPRDFTDAKAAIAQKLHSRTSASLPDRAHRRRTQVATEQLRELSWRHTGLLRQTDRVDVLGMSLADPVQRMLQGNRHIVTAPMCQTGPSTCEHMLGQRGNAQSSHEVRLLITCRQA